ncbi:MAG: putative Ig domain-containing protein, partial [Ruminococcus sp.]|nr:putative Ig domain-containing protein [Ruminococcus sp.]
MVLTYPDGTEWTSETFNVTVEEGTPPIYIDSIEIYGLGDLYVGEVPPTVDDLWSNDSRYTINSITWGGLSKGTTGVLTSNSYFQISLSAGYTGSSNGNPYYYFHWDENGNLPFTIHGNNRTLSSYHYNPGQNLVRSVTLSYYFDNHTYLQSSLDTVELEQSVFSLRPGQNVNISLKPTLNCPEKHEVKHSISSVRLDSTTPLPAGLSMDSQGHITGTLTEEVKDDPITVVVYYDGNLYDTTNSVLKFYITDQPDEIKKSIDPNMF